MSAGDRGGVGDLIAVRVGGWDRAVLAVRDGWGQEVGWRIRAPALEEGHGLQPTGRAMECKAGPTQHAGPARHRHMIAAPSPPIPCSQQTIKASKVPIIAICNDKYSTKLKSLRNHTIELDFRK